MKIRNGYVSNSSSSSFFIIGKQVLFEDIKPSDLVYVEGKELCNGTDIFELTPEIKSIMDGFNHKRLNKFNFYVSRCHGFKPNYPNTEIPYTKTKNGDHLLHFIKSYDSCSSTDCFMESYDDYYFEDKNENEYYDCYSQCKCYPVVGIKLNEAPDDYEKVWCNFFISEKNKDIFYTVKINNKNEFDQIRQKYSLNNINFYHIDYFCDTMKFKKDEIKNKNIYWLDENYRLDDIKKLKDHKCSR